MNGFAPNAYLPNASPSVAAPGDLALAGVASAETFGTAIVFENGFITNAGGIASEEAFGTAWLQATNIVGLIGDIASGEAFGVWAIGELKTYLPVSRPTADTGEKVG